MERKFQIGWFRVTHDTHFSDPFHQLDVKAGVYPIVSMGYEAHEGFYSVKDTSVYILLSDGQQTLILTPKAHILAKSVLKNQSDVELFPEYEACEQPEKPLRWYISIRNLQSATQSEVCGR